MYRAPLSAPNALPPWMVWLLAAAVGLIVANIYYTQPLTGLISESLDFPLQNSGLFVTLPLLGYGIGLLMLVPLGDLVENRRLVTILLILETACLLLVGAVVHPLSFLAIAFFIGMSAVAVQILVPYVTYLAPEALRAQALGRVMSGLMIGIMLSRPLSSFAAHLWTWRAIFTISAALMVVLILVLRLVLPRRVPPQALSYGQLVRSMGRILMNSETLRRRAFYHACLFGAFSVFWTAVPQWLMGPQFGLTQQGVAWVALAGVAGAVAPPIASRVADKGWSFFGTAAAMLLASLAFVLSDFARGGGRLSLGIVIASGIAIDFAATSNLVLGQRAIFALGPAERSRLNGLYLAIFFAGGAVASAMSGWAFARFGWAGVSVVGAALPVMSLLYLSTESIEQRRASAATMG